MQNDWVKTVRTGSVSLSLCVSEQIGYFVIHISVRLSVCLPVCVFKQLNFCPFVCLFACLCVQTGKCLSVCLFVCLFVCSNGQMSVRLSVCLPVCVFKQQNGCLFVCSNVWITVRLKQKQQDATFQKINKICCTIIRETWVPQNYPKGEQLDAVGVHICEFCKP